jgi:TonB family C-terminal domain
VKLLITFLLIDAIIQSVSARPSNVRYRVSAADAAPKLEFVLYAPHADYPIEAQLHHWHGSGRFALAIRPDGRVESVTVLKSTGHAVLDQAAIAAFRQWRFRPGSINLVRVPLEYRTRSIEQFNKHNTPPSYGDCDHLIITAAPQYRTK